MDTGIQTAGDIRKYCFSVLRPMVGDEEAKSIIYILFEDFIGWSKARLHTDSARVLPGTDILRFVAATALLETGCPVQYVTGNATFNGLKLTVNASVLIPRPETEELAMIVAGDLKLLELSGFSALDIGTGSGCIAIFLKNLFPGINVYGLDASDEALHVARANALRHNADVMFFRHDILGSMIPLHNIGFDLIISNPPYVTLREKTAMMPNVKDFEPFSALFVPDEDPLLFYRAIAGFARSRLKVGGLLYLEINEAFGEQTSDLLENSGFSSHVIKDFRGRDRFIRAGLKDHS